MTNYQRLAIALFALVALAESFSSPLFQPQTTHQVRKPAREGDGVEIELPDFDELFYRIQKASPMAKLALQGGGEVNGKRGLQALDHLDDELTWKTVEAKKNRVVHKIEKIDNFQGLPAPLLRFRSSLKGPCVGPIFSNFLTKQEFRGKWDESLDRVYKAYSVQDLDEINSAMKYPQYGDCVEFGVGYCTTKPKFGVDAREQLTVCGIQELDNGCCVIWGTEMEEWHNHMLPKDEKRRTRAKSHLITITLIPTEDDSFDVEYVLQLDIGGNLPNWLTTPIVIDNVKNMFKVAEKYFGEGKGGALDEYLKELQHETLEDQNTLLMTP